MDSFTSDGKHRNVGQSCLEFPALTGGRVASGFHCVQRILWEQVEGGWHGSVESRQLSNSNLHSRALFTTYYAWLLREEPWITYNTKSLKATVYQICIFWKFWLTHLLHHEILSRKYCKIIENSFLIFMLCI